MNQLLFQSIIASLNAGEKIMDIYTDPKSDFGIERKRDNSPLTIADKASHQAIMAYLEQTDYPIISEEGKDIAYTDRATWQTLWMVDPLDGTKEFIKQNGEFTVNIALIEKGVPILGVIYLPVKKTLYFGAAEFGAYRVNNIDFESPLTTLTELIHQATRLPINRADDSFKIVASRSHQSAETKAYIDLMIQQHGKVELVSSGSSIKICMVAEGSADTYPRFAPTMEWDTAAGHAIANAAGKEIWQVNHNEPIRYNKESLLNPYFIVD